MATKIRLKRFGGRHDPHFRLVVSDSRKQRDGRAIEELGFYSPAQDPPAVELKAERIEYWLGVGAIPTETVRSLLVRAGIVEGPVYEDVEEDTAETEAEAEDESEATTEATEADEEEPPAPPEDTLEDAEDVEETAEETQ